MALSGGSEYPKPGYHFKQDSSGTLCVLHALSSYASNRADFDESFELEHFVPAYVESYRALYNEDPPANQLTCKAGFNTRASLEAVFPGQFRSVGGYDLRAANSQVELDDNGIYLLSFRRKKAKIGHVVLLYKGWYLDANMPEPYEITTTNKAGIPITTLLTNFLKHDTPVIHLVFKYVAVKLKRGNTIGFVQPDGRVTYTRQLND